MEDSDNAIGKSLIFCERRMKRDGEVLEHELLYLILKYFQKFESFSDINSLLEQRLVETGKFGKVIDWEGSERTLVLSDLQRKFPLISSNHLPMLLSNLFMSPNLSNPSDRSNSLLRSVKGIYNPSDTEQSDLYRKKSLEFSLISCRLRENQRKLAFTRSKLIVLTSPNRGNFQLPQFQKILFSDGEIDLTEVSNFEEENPHIHDNRLLLQEADISRQLHKANHDIPLLEAAINNDRIEKVEVIEELRDMGCLLNGRYRGNIDCGIDYLTQKMLTVTKWNSNNSRIFTSSSQRIRRKLLTNFHRLCTVSGHSYNPVYCSVFDLTGNFLITGADDFLVKIWDVTKAQLIKTCRGHKNYISLIAVSPDNSMFASACTGGSIRVWRMKDGYCLLVMHHNAPVNWLKFDLITGTLASAGDDGFTMVWDLVKLIDPEKSDSPLLEQLRNRTTSLEINLIDNILSDQVCSSSSSNPLTSLARSDVVEEESSIIGLPHVQDCSVASIQSEPRKVLSLDISPLGNIIITGCDDGVVRVWSYGKDHEPLSRNYPRNSSSSDVKSEMARMKSLLSANDYLKYERIMKHLLLRLEGHVSPVTDVQINSSGDRVLTASTQDGSVRIWTLNSDYSESVHIILDLADEHDENPDLSNRPTTLRIRGRGMRARQRSQIHVFNVCWTCNDQWVITLQSVPSSTAAATSSNGDLTDPTRLKVWNSLTGDLLHLIKSVSDSPARCLCRHPKDPLLIATAGEDGVVNLWNLEEENNLSNYKLSIESIEQPGSFIAANVVDLSFTPDGTKLIATDFFGRWTMFGIDDPKVYENVITEQYFSSDYNDVVHDHEGNALDVGTQLPVHLAPVGFLCNIHGAAYGFNPKIMSRPQPVPSNEIMKKLIAVHENQRIVTKERERMFRLVQHYKETDRISSFRNRRKSRESPKSGGVSKGGVSNNIIRPFQPMRARTINYIEFDVNQYQPSSGEESLDSDWGSKDGAKELEEDSFSFDECDDDDQEIGWRRSQRKKRRREARQSSGLRRSSRTRTQVSSYDDAIGLEEDDDAYFSVGSDSTDRRKSSRAMRAAARKRRIYDSDGSGNINAPEAVNYFYVDDNEENLDEFDGKIQRKPKKREPKSQTSSGRNSSSKAKKLKKSQKGFNSLLEYGLEIERSWLHQDTPQENTYIPQIGDHVIYFPQGHKQHLQLFTEDVSPPWNSFPQRWPLVECVVRDISYRFPKGQEQRGTNAVVAELTLAIVGTPSKTAITVSGQYLLTLVPPRQTRHSTGEQIIKVTLRNSQLPDFLVLFEVFMRSIRVAWHQGVMITVQYKEYNDSGEVVQVEYPGKVVSLSNHDAEWPQSPWEALQVNWDDDNSNIAVDRVSPWEAKPVHSSLPPLQLSQLTELETTRMFEEIQSLMEAHQVLYEPFQYEVDSSVFPEYYCAIALPMYVDLILRRLQNRYYRQLEAIKFDVELLYEDCRMFNSEVSEIVSVATQLREQLLRIIDPNLFSQSQPSAEDSSQKEVSTSQRNRSKRPTRTSNYSLLVTGAKSSSQLTSNSDGGNGESENEDHETSEKLMLTLKRKRTKSQRNNDLDEASEEDNSDGSLSVPKRKVLRLHQKPATTTEYFSESPISLKIKAGKLKGGRGKSIERQDSEEEKDDNSNRLSDGAEHNESSFSEHQTEEGNSEDGEENEQSSAASYSSEDSEDRKRPKRGRKAKQKVLKSKTIKSKPGVRKSSRLHDRKTSVSQNYESEEEGNSSDEGSDASNDHSPQRRPTRNSARRATEQSSNSRVTRSSKGGAKNQGRKRNNLPSSSESDDAADASSESEESDDKSQAPRQTRATRASAKRAVEASTSSRSTRRSKAVSKQAVSDTEDDSHGHHGPRRSARARSVVKSYNEDYQSEDEEEEAQNRTTQSSHRVNRVTPEYRLAKLAPPLKSSKNGREAHSSQVSNRRIDPETKKTFLKIISYAEQLNEDYQFFSEPVDPSIAIGYDNIIMTPMDLSTVRSKLLNREYSSYKEMIDDILLIYTNCILYNRDDSIYTKEAKRQQKKFIAYLATELSIDWEE